MYSIPCILAVHNFKKTSEFWNSLTPKTLQLVIKTAKYQQTANFTVQKQKHIQSNLLMRSHLLRGHLY